MWPAPATRRLASPCLAQRRCHSASSRGLSLPALRLEPSALARDSSTAGLRRTDAPRLASTHQPRTRWPASPQPLQARCPASSTDRKRADDGRRARWASSHSCCVSSAAARAAPQLAGRWADARQRACGHQRPARWELDLLSRRRAHQGGRLAWAAREAASLIARSAPWTRPPASHPCSGPCRTRTGVPLQRRRATLHASAPVSVFSISRCR
jgi:hypothetical protein